MGRLARWMAWGVGAVAVLVGGWLLYGAVSGKPATLALMEEGRRCPPTVSAPPRAPGMPVDDILGLRPGFSVPDIEETLLCRDEDFVFQFEPIWHTPVATNVKSRQRLVATRAEERITLGLVGQPAAEVVYAAWQQVDYGETAPTPTPESMAAQLIAHYGTPHQDKDSRTRRELWWIFSPDGKALKAPTTEGTDPFSAVTGWIAGNWNFGTCARHAQLDPLAKASWSAECGVTIRAEIEKRREDPMRVMRYRIVTMDQAKLAAAVDSYRARQGVVSAR